MEWRPIQFTLVVDDFGVKYVGEEHAQHLKKALEKDYTVTTEWDGRRYIGITLDWDYERRRVHLSMPGYVSKALKQFQHEKPKVKQDAPYPSARIIYGAKKQYATEKSKAPLLNPKEKKKVQEQLLDIFKSIPSLAIFLLPGGALLLPMVVKLIPKLLPSAFDENRIDKDPNG